MRIIYRYGRVGRTFTALVILVILFCGCRPDQRDQQPAAIRGHLDLSTWDLVMRGPVDLVGVWNYHSGILEVPGNETSRSGAAGFIEVPRLWNDAIVNGLILSGRGCGTYRLTVTLGKQYERLALLCPTAGTAYAVYIDGLLVSRAGMVGCNSDSSKPRYVNHSVSFSPRSGQIEIIILMSNYHHRQGGMWYAFTLGTDDRIAQGREQKAIIAFFLIGSMLIMACYHLGLFLIRRTERLPLYFCIFCVIIAARTLVMQDTFLTHLVPAIPWETVSGIEFLSFYAGIPVFVLYLRSLFPLDFHRFAMWTICTVGFLFSALVIVTPAMIYTYSITVYQIFTLFFCVYVLYVLIQALRHRREGAVAFLAGTVVLAAAVVNDILFAMFIIDTAFVIAPALFLFIFSQAFLLSVRFSKAFHTNEVYSVSLSNKTVELEQANRSMADLNLTLEARVYERTRELIEAKTALEGVNQIMLQDMLMAENIQETFLPSGPPAVDGWDIAFSYIPMTQVSGDFYDIYTTGAVLQGVAVFDVSGHGVASGLLTMIAKSIMFRAFTSLPNEPLSLVLEKINRELVEEIGMTYHFLSGVMLRMNGDEIEYVNAGHPDILLRRGGLRDVEQVMDRYGGDRGPYLGLDHYDYPLNRFNVGAGDCLFLFTDCLLETRDSSGEPIDLAGIESVLSGVPVNASAMQYLDALLIALYRHASSGSFSDDLTIMVLRKI